MRDLAGLNDIPVNARTHLFDSVRVQYLGQNTFFLFLFRSKTFEGKVSFTDVELNTHFITFIYLFIFLFKTVNLYIVLLNYILFYFSFEFSGLETWTPNLE